MICKFEILHFQYDSEFDIFTQKKFVFKGEIFKFLQVKGFPVYKEIQRPLQDNKVGIPGGSMFR